ARLAVSRAITVTLLPLRHGTSRASANYAKNGRAANRRRNRSRGAINKAPPSSGRRRRRLAGDAFLATSNGCRRAGLVGILPDRPVNNLAAHLGGDTIGHFPDLLSQVFRCRFNGQVSQRAEKRA